MNKVYTYVSKHKNTLTVRGVDDEGVTFVDIIDDYKPTLYINTDKPGDFVGTDGKYLSPIKFDDFSDMKSFEERYAGVDGMHVYGHRDPVYQLISDLYPEDIHFDYSKIPGCILDIEVFTGRFENGKPISEGFPSPEHAKYPINAITVFNTSNRMYYIYGLEVLDGIRIAPEHYVSDFEKDCVYAGFDSETALLRAFVDDFAKSEYHFISGWWCETFDVPYIVNRCRQVIGATATNKLSPHGSIYQRTFSGNYGNEKVTYIIEGVPVIDYVELYKKLDVGYTPRNWKLNTVAYDKLGDTKVPYEGSLVDLYVGEYVTFIEYNIQDVRLLVKMEERNNFFSLAYTLMHLMKSNMTDIFGTVKPWTNLLYNTLKGDGVMPMMRPVSRVDYPYVGGFVKSPIVGLSKWVVSFDLNSLYPHLMQQYNMGVDTIVEPHQMPDDLYAEYAKWCVDRDNVDSSAQAQAKIDDNIDLMLAGGINTEVLKKHNVSLSASGQMFKNGHMSVFNAITRRIYDERVATRKELRRLQNNGGIPSMITQLNNKQHVLKIAINSLYGATANRFFSDYYDIRISEAITASGQRAIKWVSARLNEHLNKVCGTDNIDYIIANDTDSSYITLDGVVRKIFKDSADDPANEQKIVDFLDRVCEEKLQEVIKQAFDELAYITNAHEQRMAMKRETIAVSGIWTAKKRYVLLAADIEGKAYPDRKIKFTGLEAVRSSCPEVCRNKLIECYGLLLRQHHSRLYAVVEQFKKQFIKMPVDKVAKSITFSDITKYRGVDGKPIKRTPNHIKGAIFHNQAVQDFGLVDVKLINDGDKGQVVPLRKNSKGYDVMAYTGSRVPIQFGLDKFIDYDVMFTKNFLTPLETICNAVGVTDIANSLEVDSLF